MVAPRNKYYPLCTCVVASLATHVAKVHGSTRCIGPSVNGVLGVMMESDGAVDRIAVSGSFSDIVDSLRFRYPCFDGAVFVRVDVYSRGYVEFNTSDWRVETHTASLLW